MRDTRITIRLNETLLQRMEAARRALPSIPGEKRRDGALALSTLVRLAVEDYVARAERANLFSAQGFLLMSCDSWENPVPRRSFASLDEAIDAVPKGPFEFGSPEARRALDGPSFAVFNCATLQDVWTARYETDLRPSPAVIQLIEERHDGKEIAQLNGTAGA